MPLTRRMFAAPLRIAATILCVSLTLTSAAPAWALRPEVPARGTTAAAGLESALHTVEQPLTKTAVAVTPSSGPVLMRGISSDVIAAMLRRLDTIPTSQRTTRDMTLAALDVLRTTGTRVPDRAAIAVQLDELRTDGPPIDCPTCGAKLAHAILSDPFTNPEADRPEELQSPLFQEEEVLNALLLAISIVQTGRVLTLQSPDGHVIPASAAADLRDLLTLAEAHPAYPQEDRHVWIGARVTQAQVKEALDQGQLVIAHVGGNHFVQMTQISHGRVEYTDPQHFVRTNLPSPGVASRQEEDFYQWWKSDPDPRATGVVLIGRHSLQEAVFPRSQELTDADLAKVIGCCGINATFAHFRSVRRILDALLRLKYRAPDDTGILVITRNGLVVRKAEGTPEALILHLIKRPLFPEMLELPADSPRNQSRIGQYRDERRSLLRDEGLNEFVSPGWQDPGHLLTDLFTSEMDVLYTGNLTVGIGDVGGLFSGWIYLLGEDVSHYQALDGPGLSLDDLIHRWDITPAFIKLFIRHRLMLETQEMTLEERTGILETFDRLSERAMKNALGGDTERREWSRLWSAYLKGKTIQIPSDFNRDPVRHIFRLLDQIVGSFGEYPEWEDAVQKHFDTRRPGGKSQGSWKWRLYWEREYCYNMPGHAWGALVDWFQDWAHENSYVPDAVHERWLRRRADQTKDHHYSKGTVNLPLLLILPEIVVGHGRWAMTGDPKWWNGHPQHTTSRAVVHNGALEADINVQLKREHQERYDAEMTEAARLRKERAFDNGASTQAEKIEQNARLNLGRFEDEAETQEIFTDTRTIVRQWQLVADAYKADQAAGLVTDGLINTDRPGRLHRPGKTYEGRPVYDRAAAWNAVVKNLRQYFEIQNPNYDEVALRVANIEMAPGSGIAIDGVSLTSPFTEFVVSHDRPVDIVVYQHRDVSGKLIFEDYMVTSDSAAGIGLFPAEEVAAANRQIAAKEAQAVQAIDRLREELQAHRLSPPDFSTRVQEIIFNLQNDLNRIVKGSQVQGAREEGDGLRWEGGFHVKVYHLKGDEKFATISRRLDADGRQVVKLQISKLNGEPLGPEEQSMLRTVDEVVKPTLGDRGRYPSFMAKHIDEIPLILLKQAVAYMVAESGKAVPEIARMETIYPQGVEPVVVQTASGTTQIIDRPPILRHGVNNNVILKHFGPQAGLEEGQNQLPHLQRAILVGVGSSWRDAKIAQAIFQELLPGVEILIYDPVEIQNKGIELDPRSDLIIGMSWSGTTDSMVRLFNRLEADGFVTIAITGKVASDMGRIGEYSGGTIDVLSDDESTVATTKGFESVLNGLAILAVQLSQLQGDPQLEALRREYIRNIRAIADLVYEMLTEKDVPSGQRVLSTEDINSLVNRLGQQYAKRQKFLLVGSRNIPIHVEGELKGEEIAWIVGTAADIDDSSWQATVTHNFDPKVAEEDKVIIGFDMVDPERLDEFMEEIHPLAEAGADFVVITYEQNNPHYQELQNLARTSEGRIHIITVPKVRPTLQPLVNAPVYFRWGNALATGRKMTADQVDNSRNLAKSVVVSYAQRLRELLLRTKTKISTIAQQATPRVKERLAASLRGYFQALFKDRVWQFLVDAGDERQKAIHRLPAVLQRAYDMLFSDNSWLSLGQDREKVEAAFGPKLENLQQVVIVTDEEATEFAAQASEDPLGSVEVVVSGTGKGQLYDASKGVMVPIKGVYYRTSYNHDPQGYRLIFDAEYVQNKGLQTPETREIAIISEAKEVTINGYRYHVDPTSFLPDKKKPDQLAFGLTLRATDPDLLGVKVKVFRSVDQALKQEFGRHDTLFLFVSRSNNYHQNNVHIPPVRKRPQEPRDSQDLVMADFVRRGEEKIMRRVRQVQEHDGAYLCVCDQHSTLASSGRDGLGTVEIPEDLDDTSLFSVAYLALLACGTKLGELRGIQTQRYRETLSTVPGLVASVLNNPELKKRADRFIGRFSAYKKTHTIGGGQAYADAKEFARVLRTQGLFAEAQLNDSAWHGPLAAVDPRREKFADPDRRVGVNPNFDPTKDTLIHILMTDRRFFDTALGGDAQVYDSRNARFSLITKASDERLDAVQRVGAAEDGIFALADFPDELGNFAVAAATQYFADRFAQAHARALGRKIAPPVGRRTEDRDRDVRRTGVVEVPLRGSAYGIQWSADPSATLRDESRLVPLRAVAGIGLSFVASGVRGAVAMPEGITSYHDLDEGAAKNLDRASGYVRTQFAREIMDNRAGLLSLIFGTPQDRIGRIEFPNGSWGWMLAGECLKQVLTGNYNRADVDSSETGSGSVLVVFDSESGRYILPESLERQYAAQVVTHIPVRVKEDMTKTERGRAELRKLLRPVTPISEIEGQLDEIARLNDIPNDLRARPDLSCVRISFLTDRGRDRFVVQEYRRLARERGLQLSESEDGTIAPGVAATLSAPPGGYTREEPLRISRTTALAPQATMLLGAVSGGAMPAGAVMAIQFLPDSINSEEALAQQSADTPIGGAVNFSTEAQAAFRQWLPDMADRLLQGAPLLPSDLPVKDALFIMVPITPIGALGNPIPGVVGIPGIQQQNRHFILHAVVGQKGDLFVQPDFEDVPLDRVVPFVPGHDMQITPTAERQSFVTLAYHRIHGAGINVDVPIMEEVGGQLELFRQSSRLPHVRAYPLSRKPGADPRSNLLLVIAPDVKGLQERERHGVSTAGGNIFRSADWDFRAIPGGTPDIAVGAMLVDNQTLSELQTIAQATEATLRESWQPPESQQAGMEEAAGVGTAARPAATSTATLTAPSATAAPVTSATGPVTFVEAITPASLLERLRGAFEADKSTVKDAIGLLAGTRDPHGLAAGVALSQLFRREDRVSPVPVAFVVETPDQEQRLRAAGFTQVFRVGSSAGLSTYDQALQAARAQLRATPGVTRLIDLGAETLITSLALTLQQMGIDLTAYPITLIQYYLDEANKFFA